jgi:hypothetical protein
MLGKLQNWKRFQFRLANVTGDVNYEPSYGRNRFQNDDSRRGPDGRRVGRVGVAGAERRQERERARGARRRRRGGEARLSAGLPGAQPADAHDRDGRLPGLRPRQSALCQHRAGGGGPAARGRPADGRRQHRERFRARARDGRGVPQSASRRHAGRAGQRRERPRLEGLGDRRRAGRDPRPRRPARRALAVAGGTGRPSRRVRGPRRAI